MAEQAGVWRGLVVDDNDPDNHRRLRLAVPALFGAAATGWALPCLPPGFTGTLPAEGDRVWVMFEGGDTSRPVWIGTW